MANLNLNSNIQKITVKPDQTQVSIIYTGATTNLINVGSGEEVYAGLQGTASKIKSIKAGAGADVSTSGDTIIVGIDTTFLNSKLDTSIFDAHSGDTSIHFKQSGITITESQVTNLVNDLASKSNTGHTHNYAPALTNDQNYVTDAELQVLQNTSGTNSGNQTGDGTTITGAGTQADPFVAHIVVTGDTPTVQSINGKTGIVLLYTDDITVTGTTNQYASATEKSTWNNKQPAGNYASTSGLTNHTGDTSIHYVMSAITVTESQVTNLVSDLASKSNTGHTHTEYSPTGHTHSQYGLQADLTTHTGDTSIHFKQSGITITESQVTGLVDDLASKSNTGHTHNQYGLQADLASHSGDTSIHFAQSAITITESQVTNLTTDLASKSNTGHTHSNYQDTSEKNQANGYAGLDAGGKVPLANLPSTLLVYKGVWNANTNTPTLTTPDLTKAGWVYNVGTSGVTFGITWNLGDWAIFNDLGVIEKSDNSDDVVSVAGKQGVVTLEIGDIINLTSALAGKSDTGHTHTQYSLQADLSTHSGNTSIHFQQSGITITESQVTNLTTDLASKALQADLNTHSGNTAIHFQQSGITITESQVTNLVTDLAGKSDTGHTHTQYSLQADLSTHSGNTAIHFQQSGITITESQVTNLVSDLAGKSATGHTHSQYGLQADLSTHSGNTAIHFQQSGITITESQVTGLVNDLAGKSATGHTHSGMVTDTATQTLTNKRITKRVGSTTSSATPTINTDNYDVYCLTAQTADITSFTTNLSGTPTDGQLLWIQITGTAARAITWGTSFEASTVDLPTTTVTTARLDVGFIWNIATNKWRCIASA